MSSKGQDHSANFAAWVVIGSILIEISAGDGGGTAKDVHVQLIWGKCEHRRGWHWRQLWHILGEFVYGVANNEGYCKRGFDFC